VLVTPVYWGDLSESMKAFCDRLRRCEATRGTDSPLAGKWFLGVAAAGGSGGGIASCVTQFQRLASHMHLRKFDYLGIMQRSRDYMLQAIEGSAAALAAVISTKS
jgi:multimeric flavodoxin WrbA